MKNFWNDENGFIISAELVLVLTIAVLGVIVGLSHVAMAVNQELTDIGKAIGSLNQSFNFTGFACCAHPGAAGTFTSATSGSSFVDRRDLCDDTGICQCEVATCTDAPEAAHP